jgi:microcystin-dependent protein
LDIDNSGKIQFSASGAARMIISCDASNSTFDVSGARNYVVKTNSTTILTGNTTDITTTVPVVLPGSPTTSLQAATKTYVDTAQTTAGPPGAIIAFAGTSAPTGWLACQGQLVSRTTYAALFAAIGTTWGAGDGSTTFGLPDLRGVFLRGTGTNATGSSSGAVGPAVGGYATDTYLNHTHTASQASHNHTYTYFQAAGSTASGVGGQTPSSTSGTTSSATPAITVDTSTTGGTETKPKNYGILYIIKT